MYKENRVTIGDIASNSIAAQAYDTEYRNLGLLENAPASYDYKKYMTTTLIRRGFLFDNSKVTSELYRASINELFSDQFKNIFLYVHDREISDIYNNITNVKNMGPIGTHDFFASIFGLISTKLLPIFEPFRYDFTTDETIKIDVTPEEKREIIINRNSVSDENTRFTYTKLTTYDKVLGPDLNTTYYVNPKNPDTTEYDLVDVSGIYIDPSIVYFKEVSHGVYEPTTDFDVVDEFKLVEGEDLVDGPLDDAEYYTKVKNPNTVRYTVASGEPSFSKQYYIKDPADPENYIVTDRFDDKMDYVKVEDTNTKRPIDGLDYYVIGSTGTYDKCEDKDFTPEYIYEKTLDTDIIEDKKYYIQEPDGSYRRVDETDYLYEDITEERENITFEEIDNVIAPSIDETYYVKNVGTDDYIPISIDNLPENEIYIETNDSAYKGDKTYYVTEGGAHRVAEPSDFEQVENTDEVIEDRYLETTDSTYQEGTEYYVSDGVDGYKLAEDTDFTTEQPTRQEIVDVYTPTTDVDYQDTKEYYIQDTDSYRLAEDTDFTTEQPTKVVPKDVYTPTTDVDYQDTKEYYIQDTDSYRLSEDSDYDMVDIDRTFKADVTYYEKTTEDETVPDGDPIKKFVVDTVYYEKTTEEQTIFDGDLVKSFTVGTTYYNKTQVTSNVPNGTFTTGFKSDVIYYDLLGAIRVFDPDTTYYIKVVNFEDIVIGQTKKFNPDYEYLERTSYNNTFTIDKDYYTLEVVGKIFVPSLIYYTKEVIDNGYKYEKTTDFDIVDSVNKFKVGTEYYKHELVYKFKMKTRNEPEFNYYTQKLIDNGYDTERYEIATVENGFEDRDYYIASIDFESTEFTQEELTELRKKKVISKLNEAFDYHIRDVLTTIREYFTKHSLKEIVKVVHMEASDYEVQSIRILYNKILCVLYSLVYTVNVSDNLDDTCIPYKLINSSVETLLSRIRVIGETIPMYRYFTKRVLNNYIPKTRKEEVYYRYEFVSPFADVVGVDGSVTTDEMTMRLTENLINFRSLLERTDIVHETDINYLFGLFTMTYNILVQIFYNSAYLSKNKKPIIMSVTELFKRFNPNHDNVVSGESVKRFIKLSE